MVDQQEYLEEEGLGLSEMLRAAWRRKNTIFLITAAVFAVGMVVIFAWPNTYQSTATILLEEPEVPAQLIQTTVTTFAAEQIQYINQRVMTRTNLANIIEKFNLYKEKRRYTPTLLLTDTARENMLMELINVEMADPVRGAPMLKAIAFWVGFEDPDPETAQRVTNEVVSLYMEENIRSRTVQTVETRKFLSEEVELLDTRVKELEEKVARFKEQNKGSLPAMMEVHQANIQRIDSQLMDIDRRISSMDESRIIIDSQLAQIGPTRSSMLPDGSAVMSAADQLKSLQTRLTMLKGMYSDDHPDVARAEREVAALQAETGLTADLSETTALLSDARTDLAKARQSYGGDHPEVQRLERLVDSLVDSIKSQRNEVDALIEPDNPAYIQLVAQKETLDAEERGLRAQRSDLRARLRQYEEQLLNVPSVEQQLIAMGRELQSATSRYFGMRDRQFGAEMGEALESQSKGERFVLVEPANFPLEPASPNRPLLLTLLFLLAPSVGFGYVILRRTMDKSIWGSRMLDSVQGAPAIAEIPVIVTKAEKRRALRLRIAAFAGTPVALALLAVTIHFAMRPLDVLWFVVLRKLGI